MLPGGVDNYVKLWNARSICNPDDDDDEGTDPKKVLQLYPSVYNYSSCNCDNSTAKRQMKETLANFIELDSSESKFCMKVDAYEIFIWVMWQCCI